MNATTLFEQLKRSEVATRLAALKPRERRLALGAGVVIGCWLAVSLLLQPLSDRAKELGERIDRQRQRLTALTRMLEAAHRRPEADRSVAQWLLASAADEAGRSALLSDVEALSRTTQVQLNLKPRPVVPEGRMDRFEVEMDVEGSQEQLLAFLDGLLRLPRLVTVERLRLSSIPTKEQRLRATVVIQQLSPHQS